jgi:hypothetical protein
MHYPDTVSANNRFRERFPHLKRRSFSEANQTVADPERILPAGYCRRRFSCTVPSCHEWFATVSGKLQGGTTRPSDLISSRSSMRERARGKQEYASSTWYSRLCRHDRFSDRCGCTGTCNQRSDGRRSGGCHGVGLRLRGKKGTAAGHLVLRGLCGLTGRCRSDWSSVLDALSRHWRWRRLWVG